MDRADGLGASAADAALNATPAVTQKCTRKSPCVAPKIAIAAPQIVLVKKAYQTRGHRLAVRLGTDRRFTGTGTLTCAPAGQLQVFDHTGAAQTLPLNIPGANLTNGVTFYLEGVKPSAGVDGTRLTLSLAGGDKPLVDNPASDVLTSVEVQLDLCHYKAAPGGADPAPVADKINIGRNLHLQDVRQYAGRALLIVRKALPHAFAGDLVLRCQGAGVRAFASAHEVPGPGQVAQPDPLTISNGAISEPGGLRIWVEGARASTRVRDTGFTLGIAALPRIEGDRANMTVIKAVIDIYESPDPPGGTPPPIAEGAKMNPGRLVHLQDVGKHYGRARTVVRRVEPQAFVGNLHLTVWDAATNSAANPRLRLFDAEAPGGPAQANPLVVSHSGGYPAAGTDAWAEGALLSANLRDSELRLKVADAEGDADRAAFTVYEFFVTEVRFQGLVDIEYARIPSSGSYLLPAPADAVPVQKHLTPAERRPGAGGPHWKKKPARDPAPEFSWPAVYARTGAAGAPAPQVVASFEFYPQVVGSSIPAKIRAESGATGVNLAEQAVTITDGNAIAVTFDLRGIPSTAKRLDGIELKWFHKEPVRTTKHTLFVVDEKPRAANGEFLWEIFEWSCLWADGKAGLANVFSAIWGRFRPVRAAHDTGLVYWKNHSAGISPAQELVSAVQSQDDPNPMQQNAASCIVFDRVLMNCLGVHGIASAEVTLRPPPGTFVRPVPPPATPPFRCSGWTDTTTNAQGNAAAPPKWASHWIADVQGPTGWKLYDASYGEQAPTNCAAPGAVMAVLDIQSYEPLTVASFDCRDSVGMALPLLRDPSPAVPPHLVGYILWSNK